MTTMRHPMAEMATLLEALADVVDEISDEDWPNDDALERLANHVHDALDAVVDATVEERQRLRDEAGGRADA